MFFRNVMKIHHTDHCPICRQTLKRDDVNPLYGNSSSSATSSQFNIFICCSPLADDPLHYYTHTVETEEPSWIVSQEFSVDLGARYVLFSNHYKVDKSYVKSGKEISPLEIPALLVPDFPNLESLKKKIRMTIVFS